MINHYLVDLGVPLCGAYPENFLLTIDQDVRQEYLSILYIHTIILSYMSQKVSTTYSIYDIWLYNYIYYIHSGIIGQMYATKLCSCLDAGYGASRVTGQVMGVANVLHYAFPFIPKVRSIQVIPGRCGWMLCEFLDVWLENSILYRYWKTLCCLYFCGFQAAFFFWLPLYN